MKSPWRVITRYVDSTPTLAVQDSWPSSRLPGKRCPYASECRQGNTGEGASHVGISAFKPLAPHLPTQALNQIPFHTTVRLNLRKKVSTSATNEYLCLGAHRSPRTRTESSTVIAVGSHRLLAGASLH